MIGDQPDPYSSSSTHTSNDKEFFKVQRSPNGKLSLVYNEDYVSKKGMENTRLGGGIGVGDFSGSGSNGNDGCKYMIFFFLYDEIECNTKTKIRIQFVANHNYNDSVENRFHTHFPGGLSLANVS